MKKVSLKNYLSGKTKEQLIEEIEILIKRFDQVRDYYRIRTTSKKDKAVLEAYKKKIKQEFFPERGYGEGRPSVGKAPILQFLKVSYLPEYLVDLMLYYVEQGIKYTLAYGDIDESFYDSVVSVYEDALDLIKENSLYEQFYDRCKKAVDDTKGMGWGFHDGLEDIFRRCYQPNQ